MNKLSILVFVRILKATFYMTFALTFCAWVVQSAKYMELLHINHVKINEYLAFTSLLSIDIISAILPIAFAISTAFIFHLFRESSQLVAMQGVGMSPMKLMVPVLTLSFLVASYVFVSNAYLSPVAWRIFRSMEYSMKNNIKPPEIAGMIYSNNQFSIFAQKYVGDLSFNNVFVIDTRNTNKVIQFFAKHGKIENNVLILLQGEQIEIDFSKQRNILGKFRKYTYDLKNIIDVKSNEMKPREKFLDELNNNNEEIALYHQKILTPLLTFIFNLISFYLVVFGKYSRKENYSNVALSILIILITQGVFLWISNASTNMLFFVDINYYFVTIMALLTLGLNISGSRLR